MFWCAAIKQIHCLNGERKTFKKKETSLWSRAECRALGSVK